jgi:hypothetical protein
MEDPGVNCPDAYWAAASALLGDLKGLGTEDEPIRLISRLEQLVGEPFPAEIRRVLEADRSLRSSWR